MEFYTKKLKWDFINGKYEANELVVDVNIDFFIDPVSDSLFNVSMESIDTKIDGGGFKTLEEAKARADYLFSKYIFEMNLYSSFYCEEIFSEIVSITNNFANEKDKCMYINTLKELYMKIEPLRHIEHERYNITESVKASILSALNKIFKIYNFNRIEQHLFLDILLNMD